jgi:hypothetical protein
LPCPRRTSRHLRSRRTSHRCLTSIPRGRPRPAPLDRRPRYDIPERRAHLGQQSLHVLARCGLGVVRVPLGVGFSFLVSTHSTRHIGVPTNEVRPVLPPSLIAHRVFRVDSGRRVRKRGSKPKRCKECQQTRKSEKAWANTAVARPKSGRLVDGNHEARSGTRAR